MTQELEFYETLFEDNTHYLEGDLYIEVEPIIEQDSHDPYGAFPKEGTVVTGFNVVDATIHYIDDTTELDAEMKLTHDQVVNTISADIILDKLQRLHEGQ